MILPFSFLLFLFLVHDRDLTATFHLVLITPLRFGVAVLSFLISQVKDYCMGTTFYP